MSCNKYDDVFISDLTRSGMTLTVDDCKFLKSILCRQDDDIEDQMGKLEERLIGSVAKVLMEYNKNILEKLSEIQGDIIHIREDIREIKNDVLDIYKEINTLKTKIGKLELKIKELEGKVNKE